MSRSQPSGRIHPAAAAFAAEFRDGRLSRREFLTRASALGVASAAAYGLAGLAPPAPARTRPVAGGTLRILMMTRPSVDPRTAAWSQTAAFTRGWLEYLVEYQRDGTFAPALLERWEVSDDATEYLLHLRPGVRWNNGDPFSAADLAWNLDRWADATVAGNSMAGRLTPLLDPRTGRARPDAIAVAGDQTVRLRCAVPDITLVAGLSDYPAAVVHPGYDGGDPSLAPVGTGPYLPEVNEPGKRQVLVRNTGHRWWGGEVQGGPWLDRIEFLDYGTDMSDWVEAARAAEVDMLYQTAGDFIPPMDALGWVKSEAMTAATLAVRFNQRHAPYDRPEVRRALQMAVDNDVVLELGYAGLGLPGENHHVCPIHPEYAPLPPRPADPAGAGAEIAAAGLGGHEFELISVDDTWQSATCDAVAAQMRDAGIAVKRTILPASEIEAGWKDFPFSATEWNMRPLGVQVLALAYRSGAPWNETGFANAEFDALLAEAMGIADADRRRGLMARIEKILQDEAVLIQPYWRTIFRHARPGIHGAEMHPTFDLHLPRFWMQP